MRNLAIVIPAYKLIYFEQVLESIAAQTCKDFILYIGNDGSPDDFEPLIKKYSSKIQIIYKYFEQNLGGSDLVAHWERCIDLTQNEEWIWLFSDDDKMGNNCVEEFYKTLSKNSNIDLFHFNIFKINEENKVIENCFMFPESFTSEEFLKGRLEGITSSFAIEYIFRKTHFLLSNRFQNFDLAWGSDDATWIKLSKKNGFRTIPNSKVFWRKSFFNISPNFKDKNTLCRKLNSQIDFGYWVLQENRKNNIQIESGQLKKLIETWFIESVKYALEFISFQGVKPILLKFYILLFEKRIPNKQFAFLVLYEKYWFLKKIKKILFNVKRLHK